MPGGSAALWALVSVRTERPRGYQEEESGRQQGGPREGSEDWQEVGVAEQPEQGHGGGGRAERGEQTGRGLEARATHGDGLT